MEVGAVKQAFNNELILLKKKLNQAKTQIIHKLTRKAKTLTEKKTPDHLKEKNKRKAESAVKEVLIMKKIKARDIGKFIVTHKNKLEDYLNRPQVDHDKACARLLLHKTLQDKYKSIRSKFMDVSIKDLFMSRQERLKIKKEAREKQKEKAKKKQEKRQKKKAIADGNWDVEDVSIENVTTKISNGNDSSDEKLQNTKDADDDMGSDCDNRSGQSGAEEEDEPVSGEEDEPVSEKEDEEVSDEAVSDEAVSDEAVSDEAVSDEENSSQAEMDDEDVEENDDDDNDNESAEEEQDEELEQKLSVKGNQQKKGNNLKTLVTPKSFSEVTNSTAENSIPEDKIKSIQNEIKKKQEKSKKDNKNKNFNEKIQQRKFKKDSDVTPVVENKIVDSFFLTSTGENYMSVVEPRQPDEIKEEHRQGNRQERRAAMFGHALKRKPRRQNDFGRRNEGNYNSNNFNNQGNEENNKFNKTDRFGNNKFNGDRLNNNSQFNKPGDNRYKEENRFDNKFNKPRFNDKRPNFKDNSIQEEPKPEKLHPSWEAKKKQSGLLPFKGKKIVFDES